MRERGRGSKSEGRRGTENGWMEGERERQEHNQLSKRGRYSMSQPPRGPNVNGVLFQRVSEIALSLKKLQQ